MQDQLGVRTINVEVDVEGTHNASTTSVQLRSGQAARLPNPVVVGPYYAEWWDARAYSARRYDPRVEVVKVVSIAGDVLTVERGQGGTSASRKDSADSAYRLFVGSIVVPLRTEIETALAFYDWAPTVLDKDLTAPPGAPAHGDRYIVADGATGDWAGRDRQLAEFYGTVWLFTEAEELYVVGVQDEATYYAFSGGAWVEWSTFIGSEVVEDVMASVLSGGVGITITHDDPSNTIEIALDTAGLDEVIDDRVSSLLVEGLGISLSYDDPTGELTVAVVEADLTLDNLGGTLATSKLTDGAEFVQRGGSVSFTADQPMGGFKITGAADPTSSAEYATKGYVDALVQGLDWQDSVLATQNTPPVGPGAGDRYIVGTVPTGAWVGHANAIAEWGGAAWAYATPNEGFASWDEGADVLKVFNGAAWVAFGATVDHGALSGLGDDDHAQYHTDGRALTWLGTRSTTDLPEGTGLYYTDERVDDRIGDLFQDGGGITWTYDDALGTMTAAVSHAGISDLAWADSAHTGTASSFPIFDGAGDPQIIEGSWTQDGTTTSFDNGARTLNLTGGGSAVFSFSGDVDFASSAGNMFFTVAGESHFGIFEDVVQVDAWARFLARTDAPTPATNGVYLYMLSGVQDHLYLKGDGAVRRRVQDSIERCWYAEQFEDVDANWAVTAPALLAQCLVENNTIEMQFANTPEQGVGLSWSAPTWASNITFKFEYHPETSPGGSPSSVTFRYAVRTLTSGGDWSAWSALTSFTALTLPASTTNWNVGEQTISYATLGITAGQRYQITISRSASDAFSGVASIRSLCLEQF